jgi:hypothetical protein
MTVVGNSEVDRAPWGMTLGALWMNRGLKDPDFTH